MRCREKLMRNCEAERIVIDLTTIPMEQFSLRWRFTDPNYRVLPSADLAQIKPLDIASAKRLHDLTKHWYCDRPSLGGYFVDIVSTEICSSSADDSRRVRKWLYQRGLPFKHRVFTSWSASNAAMTTWKMVVKYWDDLWYPVSDDLAVFDESLLWLLILKHDEKAFFASGRAGSGGCPQMSHR
jgi:hypothetical protein